ncbi:DUF998 domain-containing protein [Herbiconiux solani]|uniref:DUF998 domain-containing protein n=1 Tax=Herbiconiux solani TaxID=661329 RepID=UPI00082507D0|nr:DUF998 domain-containing protein [Herbiconiux solani]
MTTETWAGWIVLAAIAITLLGLIVVHVAPTGLDPLHNPVSQYHLTRFRPWIAVSTISAGVAGIAAIIELTAMLGGAALVAGILLGIFAAARILIPFLRMDAPGTGPTAIGRIHNVLAFAAFGPVTAAAFVAGGALHDGGYPGIATWSTVFGVVAAVGAVGILILGVTRRKGLFGLFERIIYLGFIAWFVLIGVAGVAGLR